jgi:hypothetical protein
MAKQREEALMMEALGLKPKQPGTGTNAVNISRKEHGGGHFHHSFHPLKQVQGKSASIIKQID